MRILLGLTLVLMVVVSCTPRKEAPKSKVLVLYYSLTSNTKTVAQEIATGLNADIEEIALVEPYDTAFQATIDRCKADREKGILPEIKPLKSNVADYDWIFIGYPIWFGTYAPPIASLLEKVDLSDKWVVPFCTFGSGGLESSTKDLADKLPKAKIMTGYGVRAARMAAMPKEVEQFLKKYTTLIFDPTNIAPNISSESAFYPPTFPSSIPLAPKRTLSLKLPSTAIRCSMPRQKQSPHAQPSMESSTSLLQWTCHGRKRPTCLLPVKSKSM